MAESACTLVMDEPPSAFESVEETGEERKTRLSVYHEIKRQLIAQGIPENEIAFVHDYDGPVAQAELSRKVNAGEVRIVIASTAKLGVGANVQGGCFPSHCAEASRRKTRSGTANAS